MPRLDGRDGPVVRGPAGEPVRQLGGRMGQLVEHRVGGVGEQLAHIVPHRLDGLVRGHGPVLQEERDHLPGQPLELPGLVGQGIAVARPGPGRGDHPGGDGAPQPQGCEDPHVLRHAGGRPGRAAGGQRGVVARPGGQRAQVSRRDLVQCHAGLAGQPQDGLAVGPERDDLRLGHQGVAWLDRLVSARPARDRPLPFGAEPLVQRLVRGEVRPPGDLGDQGARRYLLPVRRRAWRCRAAARHELREQVRQCPEVPQPLGPGIRPLRSARGPVPLRGPRRVQLSHNGAHVP